MSSVYEHLFQNDSEPSLEPSCLNSTLLAVWGQPTEWNLGMMARVMVQSHSEIDVHRLMALQTSLCE